MDQFPSLQTQHLFWSPSALRVAKAIQQQAQEDGRLPLRQMLDALIRRVAPGDSALSRALRHPQIFPPERMGRFNELDSEDATSAMHIAHLDLLIEVAGHSQDARAIGERHIARVLIERYGAELERLGINLDLLEQAVRFAELGPEFAGPELTQWWHGLLDANIIIQCRDLQQILWQKELGVEHIMLWAGNSLLNELDGMKYYHDSRRVRDRTSNFSRWLLPRMEEALSEQGTEVRTGVRLRVWASPIATGARDTDHLETAFQLQERGLPITVVTQDMGLRARALASGISVVSLSRASELPPEPTPSERKQQRREKARLEHDDGPTGSISPTS